MLPGDVRDCKRYTYANTVKPGCRITNFIHRNCLCFIVIGPSQSEPRLGLLKAKTHSENCHWMASANIEMCACVYAWPGKLNLMESTISAEQARVALHCMAGSAQCLNK